MTTMHRRRGGLAVLVAGAAIGLAACSGPSSPHVASLGKASGDGAVSTTTVPARSPTQLLDEWAACMRSHGDPNQVDPSVDATKVIQITLGAGYDSGCVARMARAARTWSAATDGAGRRHAAVRVIGRGDRAEVRPVHAGQRCPDLCRSDDRE